NKTINKMDKIKDFPQIIDDIKETKIKRFLDNDIDNFKRTQHHYQDITEKMIAQQDEFRTELETWRNESILFEKSIPTPVDEEEHIKQISDLDFKKNHLILENGKIEEAINYYEESLLSIMDAKSQLLKKEENLKTQNNYIIPDKEYSYSLYTNITGIKWSINDTNNNNSNNQILQHSQSQQLKQNKQNNQFIKGVIFNTNDNNNNSNGNNSSNSGNYIKPFSLDKNQFSNDFEIINKIWDLIDDEGDM
ncbi:hypothetical protein DICPUDRAFT_44187, partial [Dictyostelium purpureum]